MIKRMKNLPPNGMGFSACQRDDGVVKVRVHGLILLSFTGRFLGDSLTVFTGYTYFYANICRIFFLNGFST